MKQGDTKRDGGEKNSINVSNLSMVVGQTVAKTDQDQCGLGDTLASWLVQKIIVVQTLFKKTRQLFFL